MEQVVVFGVTSGLAYYWLRDQYQSQLGEGPDRQGLNVYRGQVTVNEPIYVPSPDLTNITHSEDITSNFAAAQQHLINTSRLESRHPTLDALRFHDQGNMGPPQDTTIPNVGDWTCPSHLYGL